MNSALVNLNSGRKLIFNSAVFQAGGLVAVIVEVSRKAYLASIVPVIVNAILNEHQIIIDIVAFVSKGDFPRSRLGEKQRGKILAGWVTRKLRTLAQFAIRDMDPLEGVEGGIDAHRASIASYRSSGVPGASSLRNMEHAPQILEQEEIDHQMNKLAELPAGADASGNSSKPTAPAPPRLDTAAAANHGFQLPNYDEFSGKTTRPTSTLTGTPVIRLPGVDGREPEMLSPTEDAAQEDDDWSRNAIMHMNLASQMDKRG